MLNKNNKLTLCYQDKFYSWPTLLKLLLNLPSDSYPEAHIVFTTSSFLSTLYILSGIQKKQTIVPIVDNNNLLNKNEEIALLQRKINHKIATVDKNNWIALVIKTSGSQTKAKLALISYNNIRAHCEQLHKIIPLNNTMCWLNCMPMHHIAGLMIVYRCWMANACMLLHDNFSEKKIWHDIHAHKVTHLSLVPRMLVRLLDYQQHFFPQIMLSNDLQYVIVGGDSLPITVYKRAIAAGWPIFISYGMTEASSTVAIGQTPNKLQLLDKFVATCTSKGVLKLKGPMIIPGYVDFLKGIFEQQWFVTHDRVYLKGRYLTIIGRDDNMIIRGGENRAPETIEAVLRVALGIEDIAIGKYRHKNDQTSNEEGRGDKIVAVVCGDIKRLKQLLKQILKQQLDEQVDQQQNIWKYKPDVFINVSTIPRTALGKIKRNKIQQLINNYFDSH
jgi:O-succinylbenzoic acid--CoA ligase